MKQARPYPRITVTRKAARSLAAVNPEIELQPVAGRLDDGSAPELLSGAGVVLDCTDNLASRQAVCSWSSPRRRAGHRGHENPHARPRARERAAHAALYKSHIANNSLGFKSD